MLKVSNISDPYFQTDVCVERLLREWRKYNRLIIAVDADDTIIDYHNLGYKYLAIQGILKECCELGFYIVVYTASPPERWPKIKNAFEELGVQVSAINKNPVDLPFGNWGKIYYNILLCDRSGLGQSYEILRKTIDRIREEKLKNENH